jgi:hypothetical protein
VFHSLPTPAAPGTSMLAWTRALSALPRDKRQQRCGVRNVAGVRNGGEREQRCRCSERCRALGALGVRCVTDKNSVTCMHCLWQSSVYARNGRNKQAPLAPVCHPRYVRKQCLHLSGVAGACMLPPLREEAVSVHLSGVSLPAGLQGTHLQPGANGRRHAC